MGRELPQSHYNSKLDEDVFAKREALYDLAFSLIHDPLGRTIMDLGCGVGPFTRTLRKNGGRPEQYLGVDFAENRIRLARANNPGWPFLTADIREAPVLAESERFDQYVILEVLEHIEDDLGFLVNLPPDRAIVFSVPNFDDPEHVRWFNDINAVAQRYSKVLLLERGRNAVCVDRPGLEWFVCSGRTFGRNG